MNYTEALAAAREEARALGERLHGKVLQPSMRARIALGCFAVAQQHHSGIIVLLSNPLPLQSSAFALLRPLAEASFRGFWVAKVASDDQVENVLTGAKKQIDTASVVRQLLESVGPDGKHAGFYRRVWPQLSAYTHSYEDSLDPWVTGQDIEPQFSENVLLSLLTRASLTARLIEAGVRMFVQPPENAG